MEERKRREKGRESKGKGRKESRGRGVIVMMKKDCLRKKITEVRQYH